MVMFTASQWQELELQSRIFKYMATGTPVPSDLVLGIRRSIFMDSLLPPPPPLPPSFGWGVTMHGVARDGDPEPGRCRRTDGKKWRCSKEAYPDSKYCERHMHRGKSRSRKHVESSPPLTATAASSSIFPPPAPPPLSLLTLNLPLLPFSSWPASSQLDSSNRSLSGVNEDSSDHFNMEKTAKFHCFLDEKPREIEGSWMSLDVDEWKAGAKHEDTALYLNFYGSS